MPHQGPTPDPIAQNLFPPELVMQHRLELGLSDEQRAAIKDEAIKASTRFNELQWQMQDEMETMATLMRGPSIDEQKALAQLDKVLNIEREVKRTQLGLSIRIKNKLTPEQQTKLKGLKTKLLALDSKGKRVEAGVHRWQERGRFGAPAGHR